VHWPPRKREQGQGPGRTGGSGEMGKQSRSQDLAVGVRIFKLQQRCSKY